MKKKRKVWEKILCTAAAVAVLAGGGFLGVEKFHPQKRSLQIIGGDAQQTSAKAGAEGSQKASTEGGMKIDAKAAVLIDGNSGRVLFAQNAKKHLPPASVTKVMTLLLLLDACDKGKIATNDKVTISENAASMGGSQMYLEPGEQHTVEELLKGVIMASANDGAVALAEHLSGSVEEFVDDMNAKAAEMGLKNSHFVNTNGLPVAKHYSCAYDIGMICRQLMTYEFARDWFTAWQEDIKVGLPGKEKDFTLTNTNKMIRTYKGAIGGKTGFTQAALNTLVTYAERDGRRLVCVSLRTNGRQIYTDTASLLDYGFNNFQNYSIFNRKTWADAKMLYPSLYFGQPETVANLRPTCTVTLPAGMDLSSVETTCNPGDGTLCRSYTYNQYPVGYESIPDTAIQALLHSEPTNICKKSGSAAASDLGNSAKETASGIFQKVLAFVAPVGTIIISVFTAVPWYYSVLGGMLLLIIIMEIVLAVKKKKRRKKKKTTKKKTVK